MFRIAIASCFVVMSAAGSASAGLWDAMTVSYPSTHYSASSEYVAASAAAADCGCSNGGYGYGSPAWSGGCCSDVWAGYCSEGHGCRPKLHTRYHWFSRPSCGCQTTPAPCCGSTPMTKGCGNACPSCLGLHMRGFRHGHRHGYGCSCGAPACDSCGATEIISIEGSMNDHSAPEAAPEIKPTPTAPKAEPQEARLLLPSLHALLPRN